jgi:hypothetical protein
MDCISFSFYRNYFYFLVFWILDFASTFINYYFDNNIDNNIDKYRANEYLHLISLNISDLLAGFLVLFTELQMKTKKKEEEIKKSKNTQDLIYNDYSNKRNKLVYIFIISITNFLACSFVLFSYLFSPNDKLEKANFQWLISVDIITRIIFSKIILKTRLYKHHFFSLIIFVIGFSSLTFYGFQNFHKIFMPLAFLKHFLFAIGDTFSKILLTKKFVLPQYLIFWKGIVVFFIHIFLFIILYSTVEINFSEETAQKLLLRIVSILILLPKSLCVMKVIYLFTPQHVGFLNVVSSLQNYILYTSSKAENKVIELIINIPSFAIIIFGTLVFNEMIILKCYDLDKYTKPGLLEKEQLDMNSSILKEDLTNEEELRNEEEQNETED